MICQGGTGEKLTAKYEVSVGQVAEGIRMKAHPQGEELQRVTQTYIGGSDENPYRKMFDWVELAALPYKNTRGVSSAKREEVLQTWHSAGTEYTSGKMNPMFCT
jgi:hypothetical protein